MTDNLIPFKIRRHPIGTFHAVGCRDVSSLERDGQAYVAYNQLETTDGRPLAEVQFNDGVWLLADPTIDLVPGFELDALPNKVYLAHSYGDPWNGFATPVVDREVLGDLIADMVCPYRWRGDSVTVEDPQDDGTSVTLSANAAGLYDTAPLGWMFNRVEV